jgi:ParB-like chromosome segregation protein Spo0J
MRVVFMPRQNATPSDPRPDRAGRHKIELRPLASLRVDPRNPRQHPPGQIEKLMRSIAEFGWTVPILVDGADLVIAGNGRLVAARRLGLKTAPVIVVDDLTPAARRAYQLADNRIPLDAAWDEALLAEVLPEIDDASLDLVLTGFSDDELRSLLDDIAPEQAVLEWSLRDRI